MPVRRNGLGDAQLLHDYEGGKIGKGDVRLVAELFAQLPGGKPPLFADSLNPDPVALLRGEDAVDKALRPLESCPGTKQRDGFGQDVIAGNRHPACNDELPVERCCLGMAAVIPVRNGQPSPGVEEDFTVKLHLNLFSG